MAGRFFGVHRSDPWARRRVARKGRVLVGLLPFYALGGLILLQSVSGGPNAPLYAGSAVAAADPADMATSDRAPSAAEVPVPRPAALPEHHEVQEAPVSTPNHVDGTAGEVREAPVPPARADASPGAPPAWRVEPRPEAPVAAAGEGDPVPQPEWRPETVGADDPATVPLPQPRPAALATGSVEARPTLDGPAPVPRPRSDRLALARDLDPPAAPLPSEAAAPAGEARVVIHHPPGSAADEARALISAMDDEGIHDTELRAVDVNVARPNVRYFHPEDRAAAESVNRLLRGSGYRSTVEDFTRFDPLPSRGTVEVWIPG